MLYAELVVDLAQSSLSVALQTEIVLRCKDIGKRATTLDDEQQCVPDVLEMVWICVSGEGGSG